MTEPPRPSSTRTRALLRADARRSRRLQRSRFGYAPWSWWLDPGFVAVLLHRLAHAAHRRGAGKAARLAAQLNSLLTGADFHPASRIGPGLLVPGPCATNLSCAAGADLTVMPLAGIGGSLSTTDIGAGPGLPLIGDGVTVEQFGGVNGPFPLGDGAVVAAGSGTVRGIAAGRVSRPAAMPLLLDRWPLPEELPDELPGELPPALPCAHRSWRRTWRDWRADLVRLAQEEARYTGQAVTGGKLASAAATNPMAMMLVQRIAHHCHCRGWRRVAGGMAGLNRLVWKITAPASTCIGGGVLVPHLAGLVIDATLGSGVTLYADTLCGGWDGDPGDRPVVGDGAIVGGHGAAIGAIRVGAGSRLAPKVQLFVDTGPGCEAFSPMARMAGDVAAAPPAHSPLPPSLPPFLAEDARRLPRRALAAADRRRLAAWTRSGGRNRTAALATRLYRRAEDWHARGHLRRARWAWLVNVCLTGADLSPASRIGPGLLIPYPAGVAFHGRAGADLTLMAMSGVGTALTDTGELTALHAAPWLGDGVRLDHHALVHGGCRIGDGVRIMPGCRAVDDVAPGIVVAPRPPRFRGAGAPATVPRR